MSVVLRAAESGLLAQKHNLDMIANNIANLSTTGFKKSRAVFADAAYETESAINLPDGQPPIPEARLGTGVRLVASQRMFSAGSLKETSNTWDLAIAGGGFFQVALPGGQKAYTRDGSFQVDGQGLLTSAEGFLADPQVMIPKNVEDVRIGEDGAIRGILEGQPVQLGSIPIVTFPNSDGLLAVGHNLFVPTEASGAAESGVAGTGDRGQVMSGVLEESNVDLAEEMTKAIEAQRAYQMSIKVLQTADEMLGLANNLRR